MSNRYLPPSLLPFENNGARTLFTEEHAPLDVVESDTSGRPRLHADVRRAVERPRGFVAPTLFEVVGDHVHSAHRDDDDVDPHGPHDHHDSAVQSADPLDDTDDDYPASRAELLRRDHDDRAANQLRTQRERDERRVLRRARTGSRGRRRTAARTGTTGPSARPVRRVSHSSAARR